MRRTAPGARLLPWAGAIAGVLAVDVGGRLITHLGPGVIVGERALLERGRRTATLKTVTPVRVAVVRADQVEPEVLTELAMHHRREGGGPA